MCHHKLLNFMCSFVHLMSVHLLSNFSHSLRLDVGYIVVLVLIIDILAIGEDDQPKVSNVLETREELKKFIVVVVELSSSLVPISVFDQ
jgi:uncharacterized membrane protein